MQQCAWPHQSKYNGQTRGALTRRQSWWQRCLYFPVDVLTATNWQLTLQDPIEHKIRVKSVAKQTLKAMSDRKETEFLTSISTFWRKYSNLSWMFRRRVSETLFFMIRSKSWWKRSLRKILWPEDLWDIKAKDSKQSSFINSYGIYFHRFIPSLSVYSFPLQIPTG